MLIIMGVILIWVMIGTMGYLHDNPRQWFSVDGFMGDVIAYIAASLLLTLLIVGFAMVVSGFVLYEL